MEAARRRNKKNPEILQKKAKKTKKQLINKEKK